MTYNWALLHLCKKELYTNCDINSSTEMCFEKKLTAWIWIKAYEIAYVLGMLLTLISILSGTKYNFLL